MSLRVLSDTDRQSKLADDQSKILAQLDGVSKKFSGASHNALEDINLEVFQKDFLSIVGPSGCGKTSLLKMMCGLIKPTSGKIDWPTSNFQNSPENPANLSYVFQEPNLLPWMNVYENIKLPLKIVKEDTYSADEKIYEIINLVGLQGFEGYYPRQLSGGMSMRVSIARALVTEPKLLLADEPTGNLDEQSAQSVLEEMLTLVAETNTALMVVTHSRNVAARMDKQLRLIGGRLK